MGKVSSLAINMKLAKARRSFHYKNLKTNAQRAHYLHSVFQIPRSIIIREKICSESEWKRMKDAVAKKRPISRRGRPPKLSDDVKLSILKKAAESTKTNHPMTARDVTVMVLFSFLCFFFFLFFFRQTGCI